ncbi:MAG: hypothetical protein A2V98_12665 [Planctomycetes bacterium RBG_16_64_12]|nr:MAG: hypothetical protein A2V98_12665 [Planctomycetes bacterium RBG_16_64_12]
MNRITVHDPLKTELDGLAEPVEVVDETGRRLGHFVPALATMRSDDCPYSSEELERMRREAGGRPLGEIWKSLAAK